MELIQETIYNGFASVTISGITIYGVLVTASSTATSSSTLS